MRNPWFIVRRECERREELDGNFASLSSQHLCGRCSLRPLGEPSGMLRFEGDPCNGMRTSHRCSVHLHTPGYVQLCLRLAELTRGYRMSPLRGFLAGNGKRTSHRCSIATPHPGYVQLCLRLAELTRGYRMSPLRGFSGYARFRGVKGVHHRWKQD